MAPSYLSSCSAARRQEIVGLARLASSRDPTDVSRCPGASEWKTGFAGSWFRSLENEDVEQIKTLICIV